MWFAMDNHFLPPTLQFSGIRRRRASRWNRAQGNYIHRTARICSTSPTHCPEAQHPADFWTPVWFRSSSIRYPLRMQKGRNLWFLKSSGLTDLFILFNTCGLHNLKESPLKIKKRRIVDSAKPTIRRLNFCDIYFWGISKEFSEICGRGEIKWLKTRFR